MRARKTVGKDVSPAPPGDPKDTMRLELIDEEQVRAMVMSADQATRPATEAESLAGQLPGRRGRPEPAA